MRAVRAAAARPAQPRGKSPGGGGGGAARSSSRRGRAAGTRVRVRQTPGQPPRFGARVRAEEAVPSGNARRALPVRAAAARPRVSAGTRGRGGEELGAFVAPRAGAEPWFCQGKLGGAARLAGCSQPEGSGRGCGGGAGGRVSARKGLTAHAMECYVISPLPGVEEALVPPVMTRQVPECQQEQAPAGALPGMCPETQACAEENGAEQSSAPGHRTRDFPETEQLMLLKSSDPSGC